MATGFIKTKYGEPMHHIAKKVNILRVGEVEEVANVAKFLLSDEASYING